MSAVREMMNRKAGRGQKRKLSIKDADTKVSVRIDQRPTERTEEVILKLVGAQITAKVSEPGNVGDADVTYSELMAGRNAADVAATIINKTRTADESEAFVANLLDTKEQVTPPVVPPVEENREKPVEENGEKPVEENGEKPVEENREKPVLTGGRRRS